MPEFIYGPDGFREDLALVVMECDALVEEVGSEVVERCGLGREGAGLGLVRERMGEDVDREVLKHLYLLLSADAVAGDERPAGDHVMVFAGPGTGKTYRIETELVRLLVEEGVAPDGILVTTFTNNAADELRVRIRGRLMDGGMGDVDGVLQRLRISTIHGFCYLFHAVGGGSTDVHDQNCPAMWPLSYPWASLSRQCGFSPVKRKKSHSRWAENLLAPN